MTFTWCFWILSEQWFNFSNLTPILFSRQWIFVKESRNWKRKFSIYSPSWIIKVNLKFRGELILINMTLTATLQMRLDWTWPDFFLDYKDCLKSTSPYLDKRKSKFWSKLRVPVIIWCENRNITLIIILDGCYNFVWLSR